MAPGVDTVQALPQCAKRPEVVPTGGGLGAEIRDIDLRRIDDAAFILIRRAWLDHQVMSGVASDRILKTRGDLHRARCAVIATGLVGASAFLVPVVLVHNLPTAVICLTLAFLFTELVVAPIWAIPMDIAPGYAGTASGLMNLGFGIAGTISPWLFGYLVDVTGSWALPFVGSVGLLILGAALILRLRPDQPFVEEAAVSPAG